MAESTPVKEGVNAIDILYEHFEPKRDSAQRPAFVLHVLGRSFDSQSAVFALLPTTPGYAPQYFSARSGRQGSRVLQLHADSGTGRGFGAALDHNLQSRSLQFQLQALPGK